ncbi:hypothetical protein [Gilvimarinus algae]|uniref:Cytochrome c domain-containing protein n=1 Tax=Gilvimarinus algae TaxID=3058037 RepID=A0ABT8TG13_9GAMM|nr:hypothetical protein [Gilvimarinus sp. SDUM040014]MDO3382950.1 hypothetical protein [Gilvimarinus sp. SDUM040014]
MTFHVFSFARPSLHQSFLGLIVLTVSVLSSSLWASTTPPDSPQCKTDKNIPNKAMHCPDQFAWEVFIKLNQPRDGLPSWHSFATDQDTFPQKPVPSVCSTSKASPDYCPAWPKAGRLLPIEQQGPSKSHHAPIDSVLDPFLTNVELVQRNKASFDYIVNNNLWYQQGLAKAFSTDFDVDFPVEAIEIKTNWVDLAQIDKVQRDTFHTVKYDGKQWGLVAMHITTKDLPQWFWATFEHVSNPGRCDWLGCRDSFGVTPAVTQAKKPLYGYYQAESINPALANMMESVDPVFRNYRLKGSQVDFVDDTGTPTLLGNSVTEFGFIQNSSCMTCHARATVNWQGQNGLGGFGNTPGGQATDGLPTAGISAPQQSFSGAPDPRWYTGASGNQQLHTMDFLWAMPFQAQSAYDSIKEAKAKSP